MQALGECALLVRFGNTIDEQTSKRVHAAAHVVSHAGLIGIKDIVPAYATLAIHYDPLAWLDPRAGMRQAELPWRRLRSRVEELLATSHGSHAPAARCIEIAVDYAGENGPDLAAVAQHANLTVEEVVARHMAADYSVAMLGFAPGFAYLLGLDPALHVPRRAEPRVRVPAGSVAIGGAQTGIYPRDLPGGWQLIGRTGCVLFDADRSPPNHLAPGDHVRFVAAHRKPHSLR